LPSIGVTAYLSAAAGTPPLRAFGKMGVTLRAPMPAEGRRFSAVVKVALEFYGVSMSFYKGFSRTIGIPFTPQSKDMLKLLQYSGIPSPSVIENALWS
jgi:hypothetical protein